MAVQTKRERIRVDDLDPAVTDGVERHSFSLDGVRHTLDLGAENFANLQAALAHYVAVSSTTKRENAELLRAKREWGRENGFDVPARGRLPKEVETAYDEAHPAADEAAAAPEPVTV